ncbi:MAG: DUF1572 family protein [Bacteroidia bacterium]
MQNHYLELVKKQFEQYKLLGEKTFAQLSDEQLFWKYNQESNSIAIIVKHLSGNMLSRWTDFLTSDGEKDWCNRDTEFDTDQSDKQALIASWNKGWDCLFKALSTIKESNFNTTIYIRKQAHSITEAINRQLAHYAYHIGQIVFIGKMMKDTIWASLSIPRAKSKK